MNVTVKVKTDEPFERALKRFVREWKKMGIPYEVASRCFYTKPSVRKRQKQNRARRRRANEEGRALRAAARERTRKRAHAGLPFRPSMNGVQKAA